jgi:hypothetical protein
MAHAAHYTPSALAVLHLIAKPFIALGNGLVAFRDANHRVQVFSQLMDLSDAQLADRGLNRSSLVQHVFSDSGYL